MTPKELYDWAVESGCENYDIKKYVRSLMAGVTLLPILRSLELSKKNDLK